MHLFTLATELAANNKNPDSKGKYEKGGEWMLKDGLTETEELKILTISLNLC